MIRFFIHRPIFAASIAIIMVLAGAIAYGFLPVAQLPEVTPPQVVVSAAYPGASSEVVANTVTTPLEEQIDGVKGMAYMSSVSANDGSSTITVTFDVGYPIDIAAVDVQNRIASAQGQLPAIVNQAGITVNKKNPNILLGVTLYSPDDSVDLLNVSNYAYLQVVDPLKRLPGIGDVTIFGERRYSMRVWLDPDKLATLGITATDVQQAIQEQNVQVVAGKLGQSPAPPGTAFEYQVNAPGRLSDPAQFGNIVIRAGTGSAAVVHLRDVARIELGALQYSSSARLNTHPTVFVAVYQTPGSNALQVAQEVRAEMGKLGRNFPPGLAWRIPYDTTMFVAASMQDVMLTLTEALALVIAVVFLFLQSWRTTIIPAIAIPVSLVFTLAIMLAAGFSLNMVSMLGMVLAIGLVVDDAIVVVENVERQLEGGLSPLDAAVAAMQEVTGPIIATTAVLMAVFVPVAFLPGATGRLYNQFALTIAISIAISAFNSLTLSPALAALLLRHRRPSRFILFRAFNAAFVRASHGYARAVRWVIGARWDVLALFAGALVVTYGLLLRIPAGFLPIEDQGYFFAVIQLPPGASLQRTEQVAEKVRTILAAQPGVQDVIPVTGLNFLTGATQSNAAAEFAILKPWGERGARLSAASIIAAVRPKLFALPEAIALSFDPPAIPGISTTGGVEFELEDLTGRGPRVLSDATQAMLAAARAEPELDPHQLFSTFDTATPEYEYNLDRTKAKLLGLTLADVFNTLQIELGSLYVNDFNLFDRNFRVTMQAELGARDNPAGLSRLFVRNAGGQMIPLDTLGQLNRVTGPEYVSHYNVYGSALINGTASPGYSSGQAIAAMERAAAKALPPGFGYEWTGIAYQQLKAGSAAAIVFALAMVFVFLVLAAQYESWSMPLMIILSVPIALFGAVLALWLRAMQLDVYSEIGLVMLVGLAAKNAILIVEFAKQLRARGAGIVEAAMEAGRLRLRPILMTAFAFILGSVPLMVASGAGAGGRQSIGTTVVGGMLAATIFGLALVPVLYAVIERMREGRTEQQDQPARAERRRRRLS
jgi:hydrophobe/amphiphile efflux-1 (HAE1) family protein